MAVPEQSGKDVWSDKKPPEQLLNTPCGEIIFSAAWLQVFKMISSVEYQVFTMSYRGHLHKQTGDKLKENPDTQVEKQVYWTPYKDI